MVARQITTSAAQYFQAVAGATVSLRWFEAVCGLFEDYGVPASHFYTTCADFPGDDAQDFGRCKAQLVESLERGSVEDLGLESIHAGTKDVDDWRLSVWIDLQSGLMYVGADEEIVSNPAVLLRRAYKLARVAVDVRYGISYQSSLAEHPDMYAAGHRVYTLSELTRHLTTSPERTRLDAWLEETMGERRYLTGRFRGAYPASILSEVHLAGIDLRSLNLGVLSPLNTGRWLWELPDAEIQAADKLLDTRGLLIR